MNEILQQLRLPFHPSQITWKPGAIKGERALAMPYADLRAYMNRLDEVCGDEWEVAYEPWGADRIICRLTIAGVTRSSTGETTNESEKSEIGGTVAEAQAFKRASAMFGLGRYLYNLPTGWADWDTQGRKFTEKAKARLTGILVQHYRRATEAKSELPGIYAADDDSASANDGNHVDDSPPALLEQFDTLGQNLYGEQWQQVSRRNAKRISGGKTEDARELASEQIQKLIAGMMKVKDNVQNIPEPTQTPQDTIKPTNGHNTTTTPTYAHLIDSLTGDCLERANRARQIHAQSRGPASQAQYQFLAGTIDALVKQDKAHNAILEVFVGRAVNGDNPPGIGLASKLLNALLEERTVEVDGEKVKEPNPDYNPDAVACVRSIFSLVREQDGQRSLFEPEKEIER